MKSNRLEEWQGKLNRPPMFLVRPHFSEGDYRGLRQLSDVPKVPQIIH